MPIDLSRLTPIIVALSALVQAFAPLAKTIGVSVQDLFTFLATHGTAAGDTERLQHDLQDWIEARARHQAESTRTE
jgi:hypothetical protein